MLRHNNFGVDVSVTVSEYLPFEIFLYRINTDNEEIYTGLCRMEELDIHLEPTIDVPFFRKSSFYKLFSSAKELEDYITELVDNIKILEGNYKIYLSEHLYEEEQIIEIEG